MMDVHETYCGNNFMMYVSQSIMLCTLNLYSAVCQLYLNKTGRKKGILKNYIFSCYFYFGTCSDKA